MKQKLPLLLSAAAGLLLVGVWLFIVDLKEVFAALKNVNLLLFFPLAALFVLIYYLRSLRWKIILSPIEKITAFESFKLCMTNYLINFLIPIHAGEVVKCLLLKRLKGTSASKSLLTAYLDKLTDLVPIFLLLLITPFLDPEINSIIYLISGVLLLFFVLFIAILISVVYKKDSAFVLLEKLLFFLPLKFRKKLGSLYSLFVEAVTELPQLSKRLPEIAGLTILSLLGHCVLLWLFFYAFGAELTLVSALAGYLLLTASFILPAPPGFSGSLELTILFIFSYLFGCDKNIVGAVAASSHVFTAVMFALLGLLSIMLIGTNLSSLFKMGSEDEMLKEDSGIE